MTIKFRPHHFLCTFCFQGEGYSPVFIENFKSLVIQLTQDANTLIEVVSESDSICQPCPHREKDSCSNEKTISRLDNAHAEVFGFQPGNVISWQDAVNHIKEKITLTKFNHMCAPCSWQSLGICENVCKNVINQAD